MPDVDFYKLERAVQDRFADATRGIGVPAPLVRIPPSRSRQFGWFAAAAVFLGASFIAITTGYGNLQHRYAISPHSMLVVYAVLLAAATFALLRALSVRHALRSRPYLPGLYLFPACLVDARSQPMRVFRHADMQAVEVLEPAGDLRVSVKGASAFVFPLGDVARARDAKTKLQEARSVYEHALATENRREHALLDPLIDSGFASPFSSKMPMPRRIPGWQRLAPALAIAAGIALSAGIFVMRNRLSEKRLFEKAKRENSVAAYRAYLQRGGPRTIVRDIFLPRAELKAAAATGKVEALERYIKTHPKSKIQPEIDVAVHTTLDAELKAAKETGTIRALRDFAERRKKYDFIKGEVAEATSGLYQKAFDDFAAQANTDHGDVLPFFQRLLAYARTKTRVLHVVFIRRYPESVRMADTQVRSSAYFMGQVSVPSQYFQGSYAEARESKYGSIIIDRLQKLFSKEILDVEKDPTITDAESDNLPAVTEPTLFIEHTPNMAGGYMNTRPRGVYVGVGMMIKATFIVPDDGPSLSVKASSWKTPSTTVMRTEGSTVADVYEEMAEGGYDRFLRTFMTYLFKKP